MNTEHLYTNLSSNLPPGFVYLADIDESIQQEVRYATDYNFVGRPIKGYLRACIILTVEAAQALAAAQAALQSMSNHQHTFKIYDGYRPKQAVLDFWNWSQVRDDKHMQADFYPHIPDKKEIFERGYVAQVSGHSRGSTVDLTIVNNKLPASTHELDMGSPFDFFADVSHYAAPNLSIEARRNRKYLRDLMMEHGFIPYEKEWWHFTLKNEPFPNTTFDFPVA